MQGSGGFFEIQALEWTAFFNFEKFEKFTKFSLFPIY